MRACGCRAFSALLVILGTQLVAPTGHAADADIAGMKKLVFIGPFNEIDLLIANITQKDGKLGGEVTSFQLVSGSDSGIKADGNTNINAPTGTSLNFLYDGSNTTALAGTATFNAVLVRGAGIV